MGDVIVWLVSSVSYLSVVFLGCADFKVSVGS